MVRGAGLGEAISAGMQPLSRGVSESPRDAGGAVAASEPPARPRAPGPTEANGPSVWGNGYLSPVYRFDGSTSTLFFEQRAFVSGDTTRQVPLESAVKLYSLFEQVRENPLPAQSGGQSGGGEAGAPASPASEQQTPETARPPVSSQADAGRAGEAAPPRPPSAGAVGQVLDIVA